MVKFLGAGYLIYIGWKTFFNKGKIELALESGYSISSLSALKMGFLTNALNPKTTVFVISVYSQVIKAGTQAVMQFAYGLFMSASHWIWFSAVAVLVSQSSLRRRLLDRQGAVDRVIGAVLIGLGASLAFGNLGS